ncbi:MAG: protein-arginine deiminase family protein, partial [Planctomycetota bacterium]
MSQTDSTDRVSLIEPLENRRLLSSTTFTSILPAGTALERGLDGSLQRTFVTSEAEARVAQQVTPAESRSGLTHSDREQLAVQLERQQTDTRKIQRAVTETIEQIGFAGPLLGFVSNATLEDSRFRANLTVDANRDGAVSPIDDALETTWGSGPGSTGALVLPNSDFDGNGQAPDNWSGGRWTTFGPFLPADTDIDSGGDIDDLAIVRMNKLSKSRVPGLSVTLELRDVAGRDSYYNRFDANERVRMFLPTLDGPNGTTVPQVGDQEILGPSRGSTATFTLNPGPGEYDVNLLRSITGGIGRGFNTVDFAVEGLVPGAPVEIVMTVRDNNGIVSADTVVMQVAPFVLSDHTQAVDTGIDARLGNGQDAVSVANAGSSNSQLRGALSGGFVGDLSTANIGDLWIQDGFETGYAQTPNGSVQIIVELPRARARGGDMSDYLRTQFAGKDVAIDTTIQGSANTFDSGGNLDAIPNPDGGPAYFFHGRSMSSFQEDFFRAQGVNPALQVNTDWLWVGHVDEVISVRPDGLGASYADPELAWALIQWAADVNPNATMLDGMFDTFFGSSFTTVGQFSNYNNLWAYNRNTVLDPQNLPSVVNTVAGAMNADMPVSDPTDNSSGDLAKGGAFVAFLDGER